MEKVLILEKEGIYDENIISSTNYLIQLFYKSGCKYSCPLRKIEYLLSIYKLYCMKENEKCFAGDYVIDNNCIRFLNLYYFFYTDLYAGNTIEEDSKPIKEEFDETKIVPPIYVNKTDIGDESKELLKAIFLRFANYPLKSLNAMITNICTNIVTQNCLDKDNLDAIFSNPRYEQLYFDNEVFQFIKDFKRNSSKIETESSFNEEKVNNYFQENFWKLSFEQQQEVINCINNLNGEIDNEGYTIKKMLNPNNYKNE